MYGMDVLRDDKAVAVLFSKLYRPQHRVRKRNRTMSKANRKASGSAMEY